MQYVKVHLALINLDVLGHIQQHLALPFARAAKVFQRCALDAPRKRKHYKRQRVVLDRRTPESGHQFLFVFSAVDGVLHVSLVLSVGLAH